MFKAIGFLVVALLVAGVVGWLAGWVTFGAEARDGGTRLSVDFDRDEARDDLRRLRDDASGDETVTGTLVGVDPVARRVDVRQVGGDTLSLDLAPGAEVTLDGATAALAELPAGAQVSLAVSGEGAARRVTDVAAVRS